jgi:DNA topoisomerase-3
MKTLIITEKPSVAREYGKILGVPDEGTSKGYMESDSYVIAWCVGHLVAMSYPEKYDEKYKKWSLDDLPIIPDEYLYEAIPSVEKQFGILKKFMNSKDISEIYYAGDSGREGEYIGRLVRQMSGVRPGIVEKRVWIDSFTEAEIRRGLREAKPLSEYDSLSDAAYERAKADWLTGMNFSRGLTSKFGRAFNTAIQSEKYKGIAVGRVMTCVLGMVVRRELEIKNFKPTPFYKVNASSASPALTLEWHTSDTSEYNNSPKLYNDKGFKEEADAQRLTASLPRTLTIEAQKKSKESKKAPLLFNLAELQDLCTKLFKISPDETLAIAQSLYEKKLTTYPRTDARVLSTAVAKELDTNIGGLKTLGGEIEGFCNEVLTSGTWKAVEKSQYTDDKKIADHYCIIPTGVTGAAKDLSELEGKVYDLIVRRFLSIFFPPAVYAKIAIEASAVHGSYKSMFSTSEKVLTDPGYLKVAKGIIVKEEKDSEEDDAEEDDDARARKIKALEALTEGSRLDVGYNITKGETKPPKRYTSGSMVLAMENAGKLIEDEELRAQIKGCGIGTSATRAGIIKKLIDDDYIKLNKKTQVLTPAPAGEYIYNLVLPILPELFSPEITASWEQGLENIRAKTITAGEYNDKTNAYITKGVGLIKAAAAPAMPAASPAASAEAKKCPKCGGETVLGKFGWYCKAKCGFYPKQKVFGRELTDKEVEKLLSGKEVSFTSNGKKTTVLPEIVEREWQGIKYLNWKTK